MNFLKKLATPFVAIWRWIKDTAWVQPLLIVGCIFAVIFSIPYIVQGFQSLNSGSTGHLAYFEKNQLSLKNTHEGKSDADIFFNSLKDIMHPQDGEDTEANKEAFTKKYGKKFYFTFVQENCENCENLKKGMEQLTKDWTNRVDDGSKFKFYSVIGDTKFEDDDNYISKTPFGYLIDQQTWFFEDLREAGKTSYYATNLGKDRDAYLSKLDKFLEVNPTSPSVDLPTTIVFDMESKDIISQVFFGVSGNNDIERAKFLANAWTGSEIFSADYNK